MNKTKAERFVRSRGRWLAGLLLAVSCGTAGTQAAEPEAVAVQARPTSASAASAAVAEGRKHVRGASARTEAQAHPGTKARAAASPSTAPADAEAKGAPASNGIRDDDGHHMTRTFATMGAGAQPVRLTTWHDGYTIKVPLAPREVLRGAYIHLDAVNSTALIRSRSALTVRINGRVLQQFPLDPDKTHLVQDIVIPGDWLKVGYNEVTFEVIQHYTYDCEDPSSPELWTELNTIQSTITLDFAGLRPNLNPTLAQLALAFDERAWLHHPVAFVSGSEHVNEAQLAAASMVAQGIALRMGTEPVHYQVFGANAGVSPQPSGDPNFPGLSQNVVLGRDVVLIGRRAELSRYMSTGLYRATETSPFVGIYPMAQGDSMVLLVTGETDADVMAAARSLADPSFRFSEHAAETVKGDFGFKPPAELVPSHASSFADFAYRTASTRGSKLQSIYVKFKTPSDYGAQKGDLATVRLHFSYGAGLRRDSSLVLRLNGEFAMSVPLNDESGSEFLKYEVKLPAQFIRPGFNTLSFEPVMVSHRDRCDAQRDDGMLLTVYEDSTIELPSPTVVPQAPDLARFSQGLWPYEKQVQLFVMDPSPATAVAALSLVSTLAQERTAPIEVALQFSPFAHGHFMAVGAAKGLVPFMAKALPFGDYDWATKGQQAAFLQGVEGDRVITTFTSGQAEVLQDALYVLNRKGLWNGMEGAATFVDTVEPSITNEPAQKTKAFGVTSRYVLLLNDWKSVIFLVLGLAALFAFAFIGAVRRLALKRTQANSRVRPGEDDDIPLDD